MSRAGADSSVFHAIADPTRRAALDLLREQEQTVTARLERLRRNTAGLTQSAFSQHLAVLRRAGLVSARKSGRLRVYSIRPEPLAEVAGWVSEYDRLWAAIPAGPRTTLARHIAATGRAQRKAEHRNDDRTPGTT